MGDTCRAGQGGAGVNSRAENLGRWWVPGVANHRSLRQAGAAASQ